MKLRPTFVLCLTLGLLTSAVSVPAAGAQEVTAAAERGWVGMSVDVGTTLSMTGRTTRLAVSDVIPGSPAAEAGLLPGDSLLSVNGRGASDFVTFMRGLHVGDEVRVVVSRQGRPLTLRMKASARPADFAEEDPRWTLSLGSDSMADIVFRAMDSLRVRLIQSGDGTVSVVTLPGPGGPPPPNGRIRLRTMGGSTVGFFGPPDSQDVRVQILPEVRPPFSFFVFKGDRTDSLRTEMERLNQRIREIQAQQTTRLRQISSSDLRGRAAAEDPELRKLSEDLSEASRKSAELYATMQRVAREEAHGQWTAVASADPANGQGTLRPLAPYLLGQNRAAGAEVVDLRPELAEYFHVEGGVLVVDVPEGTPAAEAGVQPGDVLTQVDGQAIRTIQDLRLGLSRPGTDAVRLTLVRKGQTLEVSLRR